MRPSRVTCVASTISSPAPEYARWPRWMRCQSFMQPSSAEYWHIGETTMRLGSVTPPSWMGVKSLGSGNRDSPFRKGLPERLGKREGAGLVAVQAQRVGGDRHALAAEAGDIALLDHRQRLLHRLGGVLDQASGQVARRERAVVGVAAVGEDFTRDAHARAFCYFMVFAIR